MRILYIAARPLEINTSSSIRNQATIEGLLKSDHSVSLITTEPDKNHLNFDESISVKGLDIKYLKLNGPQKYAKFARKYKFLNALKKFAGIVISKAEVYDNLKGIADYALKIDIDDNMYDLIISSSDPKSSHLFVSRMFENARIKSTPWIQIWGDPFLSDITKNSKSLSLKIKKEENRLLKYASKVIYVSDLTLKEQKKIYPHYAAKMFHVPIPYIKKAIYPVYDKRSESLTFLYCGEYLSGVRDIKPLYESIKAAGHKLVICGNSDLKLESTDRIKIYPRISFEKTRDLEKECDVLVHLSNLKGSQIPGKIYQYSGTNKLILFILDGKAEELFNTFSKYKRYIFCRNNIADISDAIMKISRGMYKDTKFAVEDFEPARIARRIIEMK